jgi:hypothetical protein
LIKNRGRESGAVPNFKTGHKKDNKNSDPDLLEENK